ncbi:type II secretion system minor pseudopilin GspK, partial [Sphingorhabdus sp.]|uniref:type II secretion system minor pseudopilin GspK n=1 Tax=Sphingorhabdus sp. TaxID=1902408 RepID=UPI002637AAA2
MMPAKPSERGAALLSVLLMVAVLAVIAATTLDRLTLSSKLTSNGNALAQARMFTYAAEAIAVARIEDLLARDAAQTTLEGDWLGKPQSLPIPLGSATATLRDADNCFNLNSLVTDADGRYLANATGTTQMTSLMVALGTDENTARNIASAATDWADSDTTPVTNGVEDDAYRSATTPYLAANRLFAHPSELRAVKGVTPAVYAKLQDWICALPKSALSPLNVNTLLPEQAPLLAMLFAPGKMNLSTARSYLAKRPSNGYGSLIRFWAAPELAALEPTSQVQGQIKLTSNYFLLNTQVSFGELTLAGQSMIVASPVPAPARVVWRSWGHEE